MKLRASKHDRAWLLSLGILFAVPSCEIAREQRATPTEANVYAPRKVEEPDPLPSWEDRDTKHAIVAFVERVTHEGGPDFVPIEARIATFDNDGTLWTEEPIYVQAAFVEARVKELAPQHPEWKDTQPFKGVLENDLKAVAATGDAGVMKLLAAASAGITTDEFEQQVSAWLRTARHPRFDRPYTELIYQPMVFLSPRSSQLHSTLHDVEQAVMHSHL